MLPAYFTERINLFSEVSFDTMEDTQVYLNSDEKLESIKCEKMTCDVTEYYQNQNREILPKSSI